MNKQRAESAGDARLRQRFLLIGLTGALPLFLVALLLINVAYSTPIEFGVQEQRGLVFQRLVEDVFETLPPYAAAARRAALARAPTSELTSTQHDVDAALRKLSQAYDGELGRQLGFTASALRAKGRADAELAALQSRWNELERAPVAVAAEPGSTRRVVACLSAMSTQVGDSSNLILDHDLDSFYLADIALTLPQAEARQLEITAEVGAGLRRQPPVEDGKQLAVMAALVREADLARLEHDAQSTLREDARFNGVSPSLQASLPVVSAEYSAATEQVLQRLDELSAGRSMASEDFEAAGALEQVAGYRLFRTSAAELEQLLTTRLIAIRGKRARAYSMIVATLLGAAAVMGFLIRGLLATRYAEIFAVQESQQRFSHIFDNSPIPITLARLDDGKHIAANESFLKFSGFSRAEVIGHSTAEMGIYVDAGLRDQIRSELRAHSRVHGAEMQFRTKSGEVRTNVLWLEVMTIDAERYVLAMSLDMTEQQAATRQQRELEEQLRQAQKLDALGTLAGGIAHDFNNILGAIMSYTELTKLDHPSDVVLTQNLNEVLHASQRATALVRQILFFSRHQKEERQSLQLGPIVKEALSLMRATLPTTIAIEQMLDSPAADVLVNATQVHQIVMNLCTNAAHAIQGKGKLGLEIAQVAIGEGPSKPHVELRAGDYVRLTISDTGHGMDVATMKRIFEPFFTTKKAGEGTGLGLSVVHGIVKEYGGGVTIDSEVGRGTAFAVYLPVSSVAETLAAPDDMAAPRGNGQRVLFVDDEAALGDAAQKMLSRLGYAPTVFRSAVEALSDLRKAPDGYAVLITDFTMPELTGAELIAEALAIRPDLRVILASGSTSQLSGDQMHRLGVHEVLSKPVGYVALSRALQRALSS